MFSALQNVLFLLLGREPGVSWKETLMAVFHGGSWNIHICLDLPALQVEIWRKRWAPHSSAGLPWKMVSSLEIYLSWGDSGLNLLCHRNHQCHKSISLELKGWLWQQTPRQGLTVLVVMDFCWDRHCWGWTICWSSGVSSVCYLP